MDVFFFSRDELKDLIEILRETGKVFWNIKRELPTNLKNIKTNRIEELDEEYIREYQVPGFRAYETYKSFLLPPNFKVAEYPDKGWQDIKEIKQKTVLLGLKGCDLVGFSMLDKVFLDDPDFIDPFYKRNRESLVIISSDCTETGDSCFCNLLGNTPYAKDGFDLNISMISDGFLLESGSTIGEEIIGELSLSEATTEQISDRDKRREKVLKDLEEQNSKFMKAFEGLSTITSEGYDSTEGWALGSTCVSCGACTNVCPVCYCFTLFDRFDKKGEKAKRFMVWDSCQHKGFSQMAGGLNPRFSLMERFKNRYYHKFFRFHERYGDYKCTGCGRCIDNCLGDIDMREVIAGIKLGEAVK